MDWKNQLTRTPYLVLFIVLISIGVGTASALITITLAGNVVVTDNLTVGKDLTVNGAITGALNVYTVTSSDIVINSGGFTGTQINCLDNNDIALSGGFFKQTGVENSVEIRDFLILQAEFDSLSQQWDPALFFVFFHNEGPGSITMRSQLICLDVPGTQ